MMLKQYKWFFDFAKEERWLSEMSEKGYKLLCVNCSGRYTFQKADAKKENYRIDYRIFKNNKDFEDYICIFEDSGWKHIAGNKSSGTQYFMQAKQDASNDIFSDSASKAGRYKRLSAMWLSLVTAFIPPLVVIVMTNQYKLSAFTNPKELYLTPGLWEMSGIQFWRALLFETPFAIGRGFMWLIFLIIIVFYMAAYIKTRRQYRRSLRGLI